MDEGEEPTELTAMTSPNHELDAVTTRLSNSHDNHNNNTIATTNNNSSNSNNGRSRLVSEDRPSVTFRKAWLKEQLRSPAGKCLFLVAVLGLSVLAAYLGSKIVVGALFMNDCIEEPFVPIYLVVSSLVFTLFIAIICIIFLRCRHRYEEEESISPIYLLSMVYTFLHLVLQLAGSVCVIRTSNRFSSEEDGEDDNLCSGTLLTYAFGVVVFELILSSIVLAITVVLLCQVIYIECCQGDKTPRTNNSSSLPP